jgi:hypothetical protein
MMIRARQGRRVNVMGTTRRNEQHHSLRISLPHGLGDRSCHLPGVFVDRGVVLDPGSGGHPRGGHELECGDGPADLQVLGPAVQSAQEGGVAPVDVDDLLALQVSSH